MEELSFESESYSQSHDEATTNAESWTDEAVPFGLPEGDTDSDKAVLAYLHAMKREREDVSAQHAAELPSASEHVASRPASTRKRCGYVDYLLHLQSAASTKTTTVLSKPPEFANSPLASDAALNTITFIPTTPSETPEGRWKRAVLTSFKDFRTYLARLSQHYPWLSGEEIGKPCSEERDWDEDGWMSVILAQDVTVSVLGAADSVRACLVLEIVADILTSNNKQIFMARRAHEGATSKKDTNTSPSEPFGLSPLLFRRVLRWCFAALSSLDELQSLSADVAHTLQVIRRCCRWLRTTLDPEYLLNEVRVVELIIEEFFVQR